MMNSTKTMMNSTKTMMMTRFEELLMTNDDDAKEQQKWLDGP